MDSETPPEEQDCTYDENSEYLEGAGLKPDYDIEEMEDELSDE